MRKRREGSSVVELQRFVQSVPDLRALLAEETTSIHELLVRHELRRTVLELAHVLAEAARGECDRTRAAVLRGASLAAAELGAFTSIVRASPGSARSARDRPGC